MKKNESVCGVSASGADVSMAETTSSFEGHRPSRFSAKAGAKRWYGRALALSLASVSLLATVACGTSDEEVVDEAAGRQTGNRTQSQGALIRWEKAETMEALWNLGVQCGTAGGREMSCGTNHLVCGIRKHTGAPGCSYANVEPDYKEGYDPRSEALVYLTLQRIAQQNGIGTMETRSYRQAYYVSDVFFGQENGVWVGKRLATLHQPRANGGGGGGAQTGSCAYLCASYAAFACKDSVTEAKCREGFGFAPACAGVPGGREVGIYFYPGKQACDQLIDDSYAVSGGRRM
jgi:hypothetical protein